MNHCYAHTLQNPDGTTRPTAEWELLFTGTGNGHLERVARRAAELAAKFDAAEWGQLAGLWHDIGKYSKEFQAYLLQQSGFEAHLEQISRVDHSTAGARLANETLQPWGRMMAYVIAGHHAGLANATGERSSLQSRLTKDVPAIDAAPASLLQPPAQLPQPNLTIDTADERRAAFQLALFTRMVFSSLVDADFLATESFMNPAQAVARPTGKNRLAAMQIALDEHLTGLAARGSKNNVDRMRQQVLAACRDAAEFEPGLFTLTVPTGGGKTLASLAFALRHARRCGLDRVIYAIPFTSIVEQTADVFRDVFGKLGNDVMLEHHSNLDPKDERTSQSRLAAENWDASLVVTTNVQLFESLFAARPSRCRKLHNIVRSVIVLDEAQTLPVELLQPCLAVLRELAADYRCSIVLCTATQPALNYRDGFPIGLNGVREIIPKPEELYRRMKRVEVKSLGPTDDEQLVDRLSAERSFLTIVNTRAHAARLYQALKQRLGDGNGLVHLSTLLCGQHRSDLISVIRGRLAADQSCRVVSTQLIEAGVDVDFPVVYRALSGIDSIAQAAGRCNREGERDRAMVWVFEPTDVRLRGYLAAVASTAREVMPDHDDLLDPAAVTQYFELHYWRHADRWDKRDVMKCFPTPAQRFAFDFRAAAERFRMIEDASKSVFVPYGAEGERLVEQLRAVGPSRDLLRWLQRYTVGVYEQAYNAMLGGDIEEIHSGYAVLINRDAYDDQLGLRIDRPGYHEPESLIV